MIAAQSHARQSRLNAGRHDGLTTREYTPQVAQERSAKALKVLENAFEHGAKPAEALLALKTRIGGSGAPGAAAAGAAGALWSLLPLSSTALRAPLSD